MNKKLRIQKLVHHVDVRNIFFVYGGSFINGLSLFAINIILARGLSVQGFAIFSLATLALATIAEMSDFGLNGGLTRFAPYYLKHGQDDKLKQLVKMIWNWRVWMSVFLTVAGVVGTDMIATYIFGQPVLSEYLRISFLGIAGVVFLGFTSTYLKASEQFRYDAVLQSLKGVLRVVVVAVLSVSGIENIGWYLLVYILVPWILFFFSYRRLPENFNKISIDPETSVVLKKKIAQFSFWLTLWSLSAIVASRVDQVMLSYMLSLKDVALYSTAFQFVFVYSLGLQSVSAVLIPKFSSMKTKTEITEYIKKLYKFLPLLILLLCGGIYLSQFLFPFVFGAKYVDAVPVYLV
ncbi:MAG: oligosaccharide flippase family protein, partial [Candidatus Magasanikbacteria bacterium]|nr:oligosaccharide flippase family protein [Candidatus Magasanikbacteria bacterium]